MVSKVEKANSERCLKGLVTEVRPELLGHSGKDVHETMTTATQDPSIMDEEGSD